MNSPDGIPLEPFIILGLMAYSAIAERREAGYAKEWQRLLDITHHGTPLKPYDWKLEA